VRKKRALFSYREREKERPEGGALRSTVLIITRRSVRNITVPKISWQCPFVLLVKASWWQG